MHCLMCGDVNQRLLFKIRIKLDPPFFRVSHAPAPVIALAGKTNPPHLFHQNHRAELNQRSTDATAHEPAQPH